MCTWSGKPEVDVLALELPHGSPILEGTLLLGAGDGGLQEVGVLHSCIFAVALAWQLVRKKIVRSKTRRMNPIRSQTKVVGVQQNEPGLGSTRKGLVTEGDAHVSC